MSRPLPALRSLPDPAVRSVSSSLGRKHRPSHLEPLRSGSRQEKRRGSESTNSSIGNSSEDSLESLPAIPSVTDDGELSGTSFLTKTPSPIVKPLTPLKTSPRRGSVAQPTPKPWLEFTKEQTRRHSEPSIPSPMKPQKQLPSPIPQTAAFTAPCIGPEAYPKFLRAFPKYDAEAIDNLRASEFSRLGDQVYLDYTGGSLHGQTQLKEIQEYMSHGLHGNPHSVNPSSERSTAAVESARRAVREFFHAAEEYEVIFTSNASNAIKIVGDSFNFENGSLLLLADNHNSVNGLRETAKAQGAEVTYMPCIGPDIRAETSLLYSLLEAEEGRETGKLFAFPAQSNLSGVQHPLQWISRAHRFGWDVLLDAAAFVPTNTLDLLQWRPDFVPLSFYKMFGFPTGVGALLVRRDKFSKLTKKTFYGGNVEDAGVVRPFHLLVEGPGAFEDGTVNYLGIPGVEIGLKFLRGVGMERIHSRVEALTEWLLEQLPRLRHPSTEIPLVVLYGPSDLQSRGGTIALNLRAPDGKYIRHSIIQSRAAERKISLRYGCFCNPGAMEMALQVCYGRCPRIFGFKPAAIRLSFGLASNFADANAVLELLVTFLE